MLDQQIKGQINRSNAGPTDQMLDKYMRTLGILDTIILLDYSNCLVVAHCSVLTFLVLMDKWGEWKY